MAGSDSSSGEASQLPKEPDAATATIKINTKLPRRQLTLIAITVLLNVLLWSSLICLITTVYQIASRPGDTTNIPSEVLTLTSALATVAYIVLHTVFSLKQRIWKHQRRNPSIVKKTSYIAIRVAVTLCILWLLTSGWNMITVARRSVCLSEGPGLLSWEAGPTCHAGRAGMAFAMIALMASCTLFWMLSVVRRPFEAHLLKHGYRSPSAKIPLTPSVSRRPSPSRSASFSEKYRRGRVSASTHRSTPSNTSNTDVDTIDLNATSPPPSILAPSPMRVGLGIFTSNAQPPPLPPAFAPPPRTSSVEAPPAVFQPSASNQHLPPPPRMSALITPSGFVPLSVPAQFSASAWRAVHPLAPSPLGPVASRSHPHLPHTNSVPSFTYRSRYSRSSVSLTRPHRLSSTTPVGSVAWSSRSGSTGPDEGRGSPSSGDGVSEHRATPNEIAYAILNGTAIPGTTATRGHTRGHMRHVSAPDVTAGAQQSHRMSKGWKPQLKDRVERTGLDTTKIIRSSSADLLSRFSPDTSPDDERVSLRKEFERDLDLRLASEKFLPVRKIRSADPLRQSPSPPHAVTGVGRVSTTTSRASITSDAGAGAQMSDRERRMTFDEVKNKPLPKIAML
ncbi:hypothetical protein K458DRAFT_20116 [Lentithecium fluviatile CBS 122367]|uniref:Uncharacterized protein n=1 Tax=Lentithecium fluviatile CBS 122367 TaxID=1168545 RepID=A0A6G1J3V2_9PLEO|nr:hypothetical protein K458DRAFT_20116 [Lentithecium fluviatile CBS 122367]